MRPIATHCWCLHKHMEATSVSFTPVVCTHDAAHHVDAAVLMPQLRRQRGGQIVGSVKPCSRMQRTMLRRQRLQQGVPSVVAQSVMMMTATTTASSWPMMKVTATRKQLVQVPAQVLVQVQRSPR